MTTTIIQTLVDFFMTRPKPINHPFTKTEVAVVQEEEVQEEDNSNVEQTLWGKDKVVTATVKRSDDGFEYDITPDGKNKLKLIPLDSFDRQVILEHNNDLKNVKSQVLSANYKLVKPYVLSKNYTYKEMALLIEPKMSVSTLQRIGPRVKEASKRRQAAKAPTPA